MSEQDEEPLGRIVGTNLSDFVVIGLAAMFALGGLYLMLGPSPLGPLYDMQKKQAQQAQQSDEQQQQSEPGEVSIDLKNWKAPPKQ